MTNASIDTTWFAVCALAPAPNKPSQLQQVLTQPVVCGGGYGQPCTPAPPPTCSGLKNFANGLKAVSAAGEIYKGISVSTVATGGTDLPEAGLALGIAGIAGGAGTLLGLAAEYHIGCVP